MTTTDPPGRRRPEARWTGPGSRRPGTGTTGPTAPTSRRSPPSVRAVPHQRSPRRPPGRADEPEPDLSVLGLPVAPGSLPSYLVTFSTILSAVLLPLLGAVADRTANKKGLLAGFAWAGAAFASLLFFCTGENWQIGAIAVIGANLCLGASLVVNDSILPLISTEDERDRVSSRGWAWGYLGGGLLLVVNLVVVLVHDRFGIEQGLRGAAVACCRRRCGGRRSRSSRSARLRNHAPDARGARERRAAAAELRPARGDAAGPAQLPDGAHLPARLPVLQRRHPDRDRVRRRRTAPSSSASARRC